MIERFRAAYERHRAFWLLLVLFVSFRFLAILLLRPGGFIADGSDYDFYYTWGQTTAMGYRVYDNLWTAYPPLFPAIMLPIFEISSRIPPWVEPRLFFHTLFGVTLLIFESGNLVLIYRLAGKLERDDRQLTQWAPEVPPATDDSEGTAHAEQSPGHPVTISPALVSATLYALLFTPVYTLLGWFEPMPIFFMLLGLDLLLHYRLTPAANAGNRRWIREAFWIGSAIAAALGFLIKLTPVLLLPIAVRWLGARLSWEAARHEWFNRHSPGNLLRATLYALIFGAIVLAIGYPLVRANPALALSSFRIQSIRPPWQSIWALLDGFYGYGLVPLDMRNLVGLAGPLWDSRLPWGVIGVAFALVYLWLYTRRYDWRQPRTPVAFAAVSVILLFLYSKGWSPQFLVWILASIVLLLPTLRGILVAVALGLVNVVESYVYLILLPEQTWLLWGTVLTRTGLLLLLMLEFLGQIWPQAERGWQLRRGAAVGAWLALGLALVSGAAAFPRAAGAYQAQRWAAHPCRETIAYLQEQTDEPTDLIVSEQMDVWRDFYPWLREEYEIRIVDAYSPIDEPPAEVVERHLAAIAADGEFWWVTMRGAATTTGNATGSADPFFQRPDVHVLERHELDRCMLERVVHVPADEIVAAVDVAGGPILLQRAHTSMAQSGADLHLVLYWQAVAPVAESYTVFTHLVDESGALVAQQDNLPVTGLAPTDTWQPGAIIRDPYRLALPAAAAGGPYEVRVGMYRDDERQTVVLPDGTEQDHLSLMVDVQ